MSPPKRYTILTILTLAFILSAIGLVLGLTGHRAFVVSSPSMGEYAPVGTLLITKKQPSYSVGNVITFDRNGKIYSHRIVRENNNYFFTKGDLNGTEDPLPLSKTDVMGGVVYNLKYVGWSLKLFPWLFIGALLVYILTSFRKLERETKWNLRIIGLTIVVCLVVLFFRPWVNFSTLSAVPYGVSAMDIGIVNTGILPLESANKTLHSGQSNIERVTERTSNGAFVVLPRVAFTPLASILVILYCLAPFVASVYIGTHHQRKKEERLKLQSTKKSKKDKHNITTGISSTNKNIRIINARWTWIVLTLLVLFVAIIVFRAVGSSFGAFTSSIQNSTNTTRSRTYFTCSFAQGTTSNPKPYLAYRLTSASTSETDISGNGRSGTWITAKPTLTSGAIPVGCNRDTKTIANYNGTSTCLIRQGTILTSPNTFSIEAWFKTSSTSNGRVIGFGTALTGVLDTSYDRHIYIDPAGRIVFGVYDGSTRILSSAAGTNYADNNWHHVIGTMSSAGMTLYVDGTLASSRVTPTTATVYSGYWKVGCGKLTSWATAAGGDGDSSYNGPSYFTGQIQYSAVYTVALTATQAMEHYLAGAP